MTDREAQPTLGFKQVGLDLVTSANCNFQLQFQQPNNYQLWYLISSTYFQSASIIGGIQSPNLHKALSASNHAVSDAINLPLWKWDRTLLRPPAGGLAKK